MLSILEDDAEAISEIAKEARHIKSPIHVEMEIHLTVSFTVAVVFLLLFF